VRGWELVALAVALAMDAFAVAVATGVSLRTVSGRQTFRLAYHFGLFQALMPILGWAAGRTFVGAIEAFDHWAAFGLLAFVGGHMLWEALRGEGQHAGSDPTRGLSLIILSLATSLDALAVGLSLSLLGISIWWPALVIGLVCTAITAAGLHLGRLAATAARLGRWAEALGGLVLLAIGLRILFQHGAF
jgi:manganese efflux pump family protein